MYFDYPREVSSKNLGYFLEKLEKLYQKDWPKHFVIRSSLQMFIQRFRRFPNLTQRMKLFILSDDWENDGKFIATVNEDNLSVVFHSQVIFYTVYLHRI